MDLIRLAGDRHDGQLAAVQGDALSTDFEAAVSGWTVDRLQSGNSEAWQAAFRELWPLAFRVASKRIFAKPTAEDLAQETLMILHAQINKFTDERHIRMMTVTIAQRRTSHYLRNQTAGRRDRRIEATLDAAAEVAAALPMAQAAMDLETALARLEPIDRDLLEGHFIAGLKSHELADKHGLNASTVRGRMKRALDRLKAEFGLTLEPTPLCP